MKILLVITSMFSVLACGPIKEKIEDKTGACTNGVCNNKPKNYKPDVCKGSAKFSVLAGTFKTEPSTDTKTKVITRMAFTFVGRNATFQKFCEKNPDFESPFVESEFSVNSDVTKIKFTKPGVDEVKTASFTCKAELTSEVLQIKPEGNCLLITNKTGKEYYIRQN